MRLWFGLLLSSVFGLAQDIERLRDTLEAENITAVFRGNSDYANASLAYNLRYVVEPIAISYPTSADQVSTAVVAGAREGLRVVARSGGHSYIANGLGGTNGSFVVDLGNMTSVSYDSDSEIATVQAGIRLGDLALALNEYGRALPHGRCTFVGIGGLAGHGGYGYPSRMWGLTLDTIDSVTVALADGSILSADAGVNADLFWGLRGAPSSLGIITEFNFHTFPAPSQNTIYTYDWPSLSPSNASALFLAFQTYTSSVLNDTALGGELFIRAGPTNGTLGIQFTGAYYGEHDDFNSTVGPFLSQIPEPSNTTFVTGDYITALAAMVYGPLNTSTEAQYRNTFYTKSLMTPQGEGEQISTGAAEACMEYLATAGPSYPVAWQLEVELWGGQNSAINNVGLDGTAFAHMYTLFTLQFMAIALEGPFPGAGFGFVDGMVASITENMPSDWNYGAYVNYADDRLENWEQLYYGPHYARLVSLKKLVDPDNVFQFPQSIEV